MGKDPDQIRHEIEDTRSRMSGTVDALAYKADVPSRLKESVVDKIDDVRSAFSNTATKISSAVVGSTSRASDQLGSSMPDAGDVARKAKRAVGMVAENPLGVLLSGVALGFIVASLLPSTDVENRQFGSLGDSLRSQTRDLGNHAVEHGKTVVQETVLAAQESVQKHGQELVDETRGQLGET